MNPIIVQWQRSLYDLHEYYIENRPRKFIFYPGLFIFFILINDLCYWGAMWTAFSDLLIGRSFQYYYKVQFPVAILGALFDSLSFYVTLIIVRKALQTTSKESFIGHLSIDLIIAILAAFWVLFVFSISGWIINITESVSWFSNETLSDRNALYQERVIAAIKEPTKNIRNIYFGLVMGISAMIPTTIHLFMAAKSVIMVLLKRKPI
ncbi:MAG: hypothetical protein JKX95_08475 [Bacteroidia bacterium]|nr:hypothetical protein [Bacteroidia bacterium]